ncbi:MAG: hypothetical protein HON05_07545 [Euryarchaeota archaeon]|nr:hypothetical protein [Euryarchaeota archaeon]
MRTALTLMMLLIFTSFAGMVNVNAAPPSDGNHVIIDADETWSDSQAMNGNVLVKNGATLTIDADMTVGPNNAITVEDGGQLILTGSLTGEDINSALTLTNSSQLHLNFGDLAETGTIQFNFQETVSTSAMMNITVGDQTVDAAGQDTVSIEVPLDGTDIVVDFYIYHVFPIQITSLQALHTGSGEIPILAAHEINQTNGSLTWSEASFSMTVFGTMHMENSSTFGADILCAGVCEIESSDLIGSAPIHVENGSSLSVNSSLIQGSRTDEDIIVHDHAEISYTNSQGTGGITDAWIRLLSQRIIQTNSPNATVHQTGIGYGASTRDDITDANGQLDIGGSEWRRIVEWVDQNGEYHSEDAELNLTLSSGWGDFSITTPAPKSPYAVVNIPLPYIEVVSIDAEDTTADTNKWIGAMVTVGNTGDSAATVNIWCYVGDDLADTTTLTITLAPGEEKNLPVSWRTNTDGPQVLNCRTLIPNVLRSISEDITNTEGANSQEVGWYISEETEDQPLVVYGILALIIIGASAMLSLRATSKDSKYGDVAEPIPEETGTEETEEAEDTETVEDEQED